MFAFNWRKTRRTTTAHQNRSRFRPRLEALEDRCLLSGGVLDPTFGSGGLVSTTVGGLSNAYAVATYSNSGTANDGKVVAVGDATVTKGSNNYTELAVARFNLNGTLDTSFGGTGEVTTILTSVQAGGAARDVAIQPDGKIVAAGYSGGAFALVRYNANGSLDNSFGSQGIVLTNISKFSRDYAYSLGLQPDGKIIVGGITNPGTVNAALALVRYTSGGALDISFGTGGKVTTQFASPLSSYSRVDLALDTGPLDPNAGKIVAVALASIPTQDVVARYNTSGSLDMSFAGGAGYEMLSNLNTGRASVVIQSDGRIIVAGNNGGGGPMDLDRLNPDGSFDATFGSGGIVVVNPPTNTGYVASNMTVQSDGKIAVGGAYDNNSTGEQDFLVARFNSANGSLDSSFGAGGVAVSSGIQVYSNVGMALEPDGRIVLGATQLHGPGISLARFLAYGPAIGSFTASPNPVTTGSSLTLTASNIIDEIPSATITQVAFYVQINGTNTLLGYGTQTSPGTWTLTFTVNLAQGTYTLFAQAEDSYGVLGDPFAISLTVQ